MAASLTPIRHIPTRTRRRSPTSSEILSIFLIGSALVYMFGKWVGNTKQGWTLWAAMFVLFSAGYFAAVSFEQAGNPTIASQAHVATAASPSQPGGNMEGKEVRFGIPDSALFATVTTDASAGRCKQLARLVHAVGWSGAR